MDDLLNLLFSLLTVINKNGFYSDERLKYLLKLRHNIQFVVSYELNKKEISLKHIYNMIAKNIVAKFNIDELMDIIKQIAIDTSEETKSNIKCCEMPYSYIIGFSQFLNKDYIRKNKMNDTMQTVYMLNFAKKYFPPNYEDYNIQQDNIDNINKNNIQIDYNDKMIPIEILFESFVEFMDY
jgi:hypothetical protein